MLMHLIIVQHFLLRQLTHVIQSKDRKILNYIIYKKLSHTQKPTKSTLRDFVDQTLDVFLYDFNIQVDTCNMWPMHFQLLLKASRFRFFLRVSDLLHFSAAFKPGFVCSVLDFVKHFVTLWKALYKVSASYSFTNQTSFTEFKRSKFCVSVTCCCCLTWPKKKKKKKLQHMNKS